MPAPAVQIKGLTALRKDVDRMTKGDKGPLFNAMKRAGYNSVQPIVPAARTRIPTSARRPGRTHKPGALANSIRASAYRSGAAVRMGGKPVPFAGWMEFGGLRRRPFPSSRDFIKSGRYLFPAARSLAAKSADEYTKAINEVFGSGRVWTNTTSSPEGVHD